LNNKKIIGHDLDRYVMFIVDSLTNLGPL